MVKNTVADIEAEQQARTGGGRKRQGSRSTALRDDAEKNIGPDEAEIFDAHLMMLDDPDFVEA
ncbi:MAG: phosphoenolpyruvate-utilizing N-terminal domain-containing protein [Butyricicoccaceae bacterium]